MAYKIELPSNAGTHYIQLSINESCKNEMGSKLWYDMDMSYSDKWYACGANWVQIDPNPTDDGKIKIITNCDNTDASPKKALLVPYWGEKSEENRCDGKEVYIFQSGSGPTTP